MWQWLSNMVFQNMSKEKPFFYQICSSNRCPLMCYRYFLASASLNVFRVFNTLWKKTRTGKGGWIYAWKIMRLILCYRVLPVLWPNCFYIYQIWLHLIYSSTLSIIILSANLSLQKSSFYIILHLRRNAPLNLTFMLQSTHSFLCLFKSDFLITLSP